MGFCSAPSGILSSKSLRTPLFVPKSVGERTNGGQSVFVNRRKTYRLESQVRVTSHSETNFFTGFTENITDGGLFICTAQPQPVGTIVDFDLVVQEGEEPIPVTGIVRWVRATPPGQGHTPPGMGIQFIGLSPLNMARLQKFISETRESLFFDLECV